MQQKQEIDFVSFDISHSQHGKLIEWSKESERNFNFSLRRSNKKLYFQPLELGGIFSRDSVKIFVATAFTVATDFLQENDQKIYINMLFNAC